VSSRPLTVDGLAASVVDGNGGGPVIVLVHGGMDRSSGFRKTVRFLSGSTLVSFDRRGYAASMAAGISAGVEAQVDDLMSVADAVTSGPLVVVGHSMGGLLALHAGRLHPDRVVSVGAWEPPMPWRAWYLSDAARQASNVASGDPGDAAEAFLRTMIGERAWERMPQAWRDQRRAEGATLRADLEMTRSAEAVLDFGQLVVPVIAGSGSESPERFRRSAATLVAEAPGAFGIEIDGASHGAHLSHPEEFAAVVRAVASRASDGHDTRPPRGDLA